jgi:hypothetical protein
VVIPASRWSGFCHLALVLSHPILNSNPHAFRLQPDALGDAMDVARAAMLENRAVRTSRSAVELRVLRRMIRNVVPEQAKQARARAVFYACNRNVPSRWMNMANGKHEKCSFASERDPV